MCVCLYVICLDPFAGVWGLSGPSCRFEKWHEASSLLLCVCACAKGECGSETFCSSWDAHTLLYHTLFSLDEKTSKSFRTEIHLVRNPDAGSLYRTCLAHVRDMSSTCTGHVWDIYGTCFGHVQGVPFGYRLLRLERSTQCVKDANKVARRMCLHSDVGTCRTICFYLNPTTSCFCSTFSLWNSRYIGATHLGASLCVMCEEKKVFKNMFCQTGAVPRPSVTQLHMSSLSVTSVAIAGEMLLHFKSVVPAHWSLFMMVMICSVCRSPLVLTVFAHLSNVTKADCGPCGRVMLLPSLSVFRDLF